MECIEARALKSSFLSQMTMTTNSQVFYKDDGWCFTGINNVTSDDFPVEDLLNLDFPEKEQQEGCVFQKFEEDDEKKLYQKRIPDDSDTFSGELQSVSADELVVPADDLENLEWLSQFVDDSTSELSLLFPAGNFTGESGGFFPNSPKPLNRTVVQKTRPPCLSLTVHKKPRSKRTRLNGRPWSMASPSLSATESSSTSLSSLGSSPFASSFVATNSVPGTEWLPVSEKPPVKKQKRRTESDGGSVPGRRCTHCQVQKTPQWRTGPLGPKTLCNACGVRFKSGRLFPEYRPACSPSFSQEIHSNSHRKVLEMRRQKENVSEPGLPSMVQSF